MVWFPLNPLIKCLQCWQYKSIVNIKYSYMMFWIFLKRSKGRSLICFYVCGMREQQHQGENWWSIISFYCLVLLKSTQKSSPLHISICHSYTWSINSRKNTENKKKQEDTYWAYNIFFNPFITIQPPFLPFNPLKHILLPLEKR